MIVYLFARTLNTDLVNLCKCIVTVLCNNLLITTETHVQCTSTVYFTDTCVPPVYSPPLLKFTSTNLLKSQLVPETSNHPQSISHLWGRVIAPRVLARLLGLPQECVHQRE